MTQPACRLMIGTVAAQTSPASTALDANLKGAVERNDIPGVVALVTVRGLDLVEQVTDPGMLVEQEPDHVAFGQLGGLLPVFGCTSHH